MLSIITGLIYVIGKGASLAAKKYVIDSSRQEIDREAAKVRPGVTVSDALLFSSPELHDQFHEWMACIWAVRWHPLLVLVLELVMPFWLLSREDCGHIHALAALPALSLAAARVALERGGWSKEAQSLCSLLLLTYGMTMVLAFVAANDSCYVSMGVNGESLAGAVAFVPLMTIYDHVTTPCTMQHVPALSGLVCVGVAAFVYMNYLQQNGGLIPDESDPFLLKTTVIVFSSLFCSIAVYCIRVQFTKDLMIGFLQSLRHRD